MHRQRNPSPCFVRREPARAYRRCQFEQLEPRVMLSGSTEEAGATMPRTYNGWSAVSARSTDVAVSVDVSTLSIKKLFSLEM